MSQHDEVDGPVVEVMRRHQSVAEKVARLATIDTERQALIEELRADQSAIKGILPRQRTVKPKAEKPAAAKRGRPRKAKDAAADASA